MKMEVDELTTNVESLTKSKLNFEKQNRNLEDGIQEYKGKLEDADQTLGDLNNDISKNANEINELRKGSNFSSQGYEKIFKTELKIWCKKANFLHQLQIFQM